MLLIKYINTKLIWRALEIIKYTDIEKSTNIKTYLTVEFKAYSITVKFDKNAK